MKKIGRVPKNRGANIVSTLALTAIIATSILGSAADAKPKRKAKKAQTAAAPPSYTPVCQNYVSDMIFNGKATASQVNLGGTFDKIDSISGTVEGVRKSTGKTETITLPTTLSQNAQIRWDKAEKGAWYTRPGSPQTARNLFIFNGAGGIDIFPDYGNYGFSDTKDHLRVQDYAAFRPGGDPVDVTSFNIEICGKPASRICQNFILDESKRFAADAKVTLPGNPYKIVRLGGGLSLNKSGNIAYNPYGPGGLGTTPILPMLGSPITMISVPSGYSGPWSSKGTRSPLALGQSLVPGEYITPVIDWPGAPAGNPPAHDNITTTSWLGVCVAT
jgi:hypothetical protein